MKKTCLLLLSVALLAAVIGAQVPNEQERMAERLKSGSPEERETILAATKAIPVTDRQPYLVQALVEEVARLRQERDERGLAIRAGTPLPPVADEGEYLFQVLSTVAQHQDLAVLPALMSFVGSGTLVMDAIADFGEDALPEAMILAASNVDDGDAFSGMEVLKRMLERKTVRRPVGLDSVSDPRGDVRELRGDVRELRAE